MNDNEYAYHMSGEHEITKPGLNALYLETKIRELKERQYYYESLGGIPKCPDCKKMLHKFSKSIECINYQCDRKVVDHDQWILEKS